MSEGVSIVSENDSNEESVAKNSSTNEQRFDTYNQMMKSTSPSNTTSSQGIYKVQQKLESYTKRLSQLGLGSHSKESSGELSESSSDSLIAKTTKKPTITQSSIKPTRSVIEQSVPDNKLYSHTKPSPPENSLDLKIKIRFQPIGSIPPLKPKNTCIISSNRPFSTITLFLKKRLKVDNIFCYVNNSFAPDPNERVGDLWNQFKINDELIISYCAVVAFG